ncbi:Ig-like domain-containing protein [Leifsonia shinshuensis]|uniref:Ig-like domain-containing protein n=1 Tax=Leifsonia shinshuensis TaxID=150026 RepID=UPI0028597A09|nr:Ig-like domain-containing protein [Leifsonia shinshuensis]MDR6970586.1 hypothetical protein [Leifsonia shinshuensis]
MNALNRGNGRTLIAAAAFALATAGLTFGIAGAANAATGHNNTGITNLQVTPNSPATDFSVIGTAGTLSFNSGDGTPAGSVTVDVGDAETWVLRLPEGLKFATTACDSFRTISSTLEGTCAISNDGGTVTRTRTALKSFSAQRDGSQWTDTYAVVSTGLVVGTASATYSPLPGVTTAAGAAAVIPVGSVAPLVVSGAGQADGSGSVPLTGTAEPGAAVTVKDAAGDLVGTKIAGVDGAWSVPVPRGTSSPLSITQTVGALTGTPVTFDVAPLPVWPGLAAAGALLVAGFGGNRLIRRTRKTTHA